MKNVMIREEMLSCLEKGEVQKIACNLLFAKEKKETILITSYAEKEGKTTITLAIGMELAKVGKNVLYVGVGDIPFGETKLEKDVISSTTVSGFDVVVKNNFCNDYEKLKKQYQYILIDAPAMNKSKAGIYFADVSDLILLVVEANRNSYKDIVDCKNELSIGGCKDIRVVLNKTRKLYGVLKKYRNKKRNH